MITRVLVANRGEIARRVFRSCRDRGLSTVAVCSDADLEAPYAAEADLVVHLPGTAPADTYLRADLLVDAARRSGADAVHPGYGFLSEQAAFARAVLDAGLVWVGPPPEAIDAMGSKVAAKQAMSAVDVPVLDDLDPSTVAAADLPVLVKASAGGGGRGLRVVRDLADLTEAVAAAEREALSAFGDGTVFVEPYVERGHHVEVQVLADTHGTVWTVGERECSVQRRHQKVVEEAPSPLVERTPGMREAMADAAIRAVRAIGYVGAGTVEFLAAADGRFWFLETNTRLQVEHPVTEATTGLDLVDLQLAVADGEALPAGPPPPSGHAVEVRLYAEDPAVGYAPQSGVVHAFDIAADSHFVGVPGGVGVRLDAGVVAGSVVGVHYDPMLAKIVAVAPTRDAAVRRLAGALERARLHGPRTNRDQLVRILRHPAFLAGDTDTGFLERHDTTAPLADTDGVRRSALAAALASDVADQDASPVRVGLPAGWRNVRAVPRTRVYDDGLVVTWTLARAGLSAEGYDGVRHVYCDPDRVVLEIDGVRRTYRVARYGDRVFVDGPDGPVALRETPLLTEPGTTVSPGSLVAPMPGTVVRVGAAEGDAVTAGRPLVWLEAMKMEHVLSAPADGTLTRLAAVPGRTVEPGEVLAVVAAAGETPRNTDETREHGGTT